MEISLIGWIHTILGTLAIFGQATFRFCQSNIYMALSLLFPWGAQSYLVPKQFPGKLC